MPRKRILARALSESSWWYENSGWYADNRFVRTGYANFAKSICHEEIVRKPRGAPNVNTSDFGGPRENVFA